MPYLIPLCIAAVLLLAYLGILAVELLETQPLPRALAIVWVGLSAIGVTIWYFIP